MRVSTETRLAVGIPRAVNERMNDSSARPPMTTGRIVGATITLIGATGGVVSGVLTMMGARITMLSMLSLLVALVGLGITRAAKASPR